MSMSLLRMVTKSNAFAERSGKPRLEVLHKLQRKNRSGSVTAASTLCKGRHTGRRVAGRNGHGVGLVNRALKNVREAPGGEARCNFWATARRSADAGGQRTCKMRGGVVSEWHPCLRTTCKRKRTSQTYKSKGRRVGIGQRQSRRFSCSPRRQHLRYRSRRVG